MAQIEKTISGEQLLKEWHLDAVELSYLILKHDLTVLRPSRVPLLGKLLPPKRLRADSRELLRVIKGDPYSLSHMLFLLAEVQNIPKKQRTPEKPTAKEKSVSREGRSPQYYIPKAKTEDLLRAVIEDQEGQIKDKPNVFSLMGRVWFIKFAKEEWGLYPDQEKYRYIAHILGVCDGYPRPGDTEYSIYNTDLCARVKGDPAGNNLAGADSPALKDLAEADLTNSDLSDKLSVEDVKKFRELGYDLLEQLGDARDAGNQDGIKKAEDNIQAYRSHLSNEYGIVAFVSKDEKRFSFKVRYRPSKEIEKLRQLAKNQISKAIKDFDTMPKFKSHLQHSLKMKSNKTIYNPELPTVWYVSM